MSKFFIDLCLRDVFESVFDSRENWFTGISLTVISNLEAHREDIDGLPVPSK